METKYLNWLFIAIPRLSNVTQSQSQILCLLNFYSIYSGLDLSNLNIRILKFTSIPQVRHLPLLVSLTKTISLRNSIHQLIISWIGLVSSSMTNGLNADLLCNPEKIFVKPPQVLKLVITQSYMSFIKSIYLMRPIFFINVYHNLSLGTLSHVFSKFIKTICKFQSLMKSLYNLMKQMNRSSIALA